MSLGKASIRRAVNAESRNTRKEAKAVEKGAAGDITRSVISPMNADEIQLKFLSGNTPEQRERTNGPVRINDRMPDYLL